MGTESKKKHSSSSNHEGKGSKRLTNLQGDDEIKKKRKSHKSPSDLETKSEEKHKHKRRKHDRHTKVKFQELSNDDYFAKNNEFATWLKEERELFFSDLSSQTARDLFSQFVNDWNKGKLESRYYEGIVSGPRSSHKWKIK